MRIAGTVNDSIVDGKGIRFTVFVQGCPHHCAGCHNPQTHDFSGGTEITVDEIFKKIKSNPLLDGVTFSGGEPFCQAKELYQLALKVREIGLNIVAYSGFTYEYLKEHGNDENYYNKLLSVCDFIIDGKFEQDKKSYKLLFKGSTNQRIINCRTGEVVG